MNTDYFQQHPEQAETLDELREETDKAKQLAINAAKEYYLSPDTLEAQSIKDSFYSGSVFDETKFEGAPNSTSIKLEINELVWRFASSKTTLEQAEEIASDFWQKIMETHS